MSTTHDSSFDNFSYREYLDIREQDEELRRRDRQRRYGGCRLQRRTRSHAAGQGRNDGFRQLLPRARRGAAAGARFSGGRRPGARPRCRGGARAGLLEARIRERPVRRRQDDSPERHGVHGDWRGAGNVPGDADISGIPTSTCRSRWRGCFRPTAEEFLRGPGRSRVDCKGALETGHDAASRRGHELAVLAKNFEREYPKLNRSRGAAVHTQFEMRTRDDDNELEIRRDLCDPCAGGAAGGVHQRCGTSAEPRPHANA